MNGEAKVKSRISLGVEDNRSLLQKFIIGKLFSSTSSI